MIKSTLHLTFNIFCCFCFCLFFLPVVGIWTQNIHVVENEYHWDMTSTFSLYLCKYTMQFKHIELH